MNAAFNAALARPPVNGPSIIEDARAHLFERAQAADAPAELRDWFWEAVRRGCSDE